MGKRRRRHETQTRDLIPCVCVSSACLPPLRVSLPLHSLLGSSLPPPFAPSLPLALLALCLQWGLIYQPLLPSFARRLCAMLARVNTFLLRTTLRSSLYYSMQNSGLSTSIREEWHARPTTRKGKNALNFFCSGSHFSTDL